MKQENKVLYPVIGSILMIIGIFLGLYLQRQPKSNTPKSADYGLKFSNIMGVLEENYVDSIDKGDLFEKAVTQLMHSLDPHSNYIPAKRLTEMTEGIRGRYGGVGIRFTIYNDTLNVVNVIPNSPSSKIDIQKFDQILKVDTENIAGVGLTNQHVKELLKGESGTEVQVEILRNGKIINKTITRGTVPITTISAAYMITDEVGYIRLRQFSVHSANEFYRAALKLKKQGMESLIFDLRYNGGGVLSSAVAIADAFLPKGTTVVTTKGRTSPKRVIKAQNKPFLGDIQLAILINSSTASASEIVSGAIQDNDRGIIVGRRSFGKGLVQQDFKLKDGSDLRLTIARYYTPTGRCIQKPYTDGYRDYIMDEMHRYKDGELYHVDSSVFVDSLKYITPGGDVVYGGGGIMPDIFVPLDTTGGSTYYRKLRFRRVFNAFSFQYARSHNLNKYASLQAFDKKFKVTSKILQHFTKYAAKNNDIPLDKDGYRWSLQRIKNHIKAEIARQRWLENGALYILNQKDKVVATALRSLLSETP